jgi:diguanylate cyclase (GGDEF)-like protein/PAS domain S-box-containing protein
MLLSQRASGDVTDAAAIACAAAILPILVLIRVARLAHDATAARSETRFRTLIDKTSDAIVVVDGKGRIRYHTPSTERMLGRCTSDLEGAPLGEMLTEPDAMRLLAMFTSDATSATIEWRVRHPDGGWRDLEVTADDLRGMTELDGIVFTMRDVTERKRFDLEFRRQTLHDALTGLANRTLFIDRVDQALKRAKRADGSVVVLFLNLDDFKMVNDSLGHAAGDELLVAVAARLTTTAQTDFGVARLGGDEFGFLMEIADVDGGPELAALGIQAALRAPFRVGGKEMPIHASIGIAIGSPWTHTPDDMLRDADLAMSFAKQKGKDRYELFLPAMHQEATRRLDLAAELQGGIERGEFVVHYQPIVDVGSGHIVGAESLVRWRHPGRGLLDSNEFLPMAEVTGLIGPLDLWVLDEACRQAAAWTGGGVADESIFFVSVNLSAQHLQDPNLVQDVVTALETSGLAAGALLLEVTETALISDLDTASTSLASLTQLGVKVAVDDFGTGYTSLPHLVRSPIHVIKIDASLTDLVSDTDGSRMVRAVVDLTHTLGLTAIALGVERAEQARALQDIDCHLAQGNLFGEPLPPDVMTALLTGQSASRVTSPVDQPA